MTMYAILLPGNEDTWAAASEDHRRATHARHEEFSKLLAERGHLIVGGAQLTHSREAKVVGGRLDEVTVTDGPYAETVEQLTGFYLVETDDLDGLLQVCGVLAGDGQGLEVRACVAGQS